VIRQANGSPAQRRKSETKSPFARLPIWCSIRTQGYDGYTSIRRTKRRRDRRKSNSDNREKTLLNCSCGRCSWEDGISHRQLKRSWYSELVPASNLTLRWFHKATVNQNLVQYLGTKVTTQPLRGSQHDLQLQTDESLYLHKARVTIVSLRELGTRL
jgi:hypothetical protein